MTTRSYTMSVVTGAPERMYSPDEAATQHPSQGEVMLRGTMSGAGGGMDGMGSMGDMGASAAGSGSAAGTLTHLEVHICSRATGQVISDAQPTLAVLDLTTGSTVNLPVAVMQGVTSGAADLHYGNNVSILAGHAVRLTVTVRGENALFRLAP